MQSILAGFIKIVSEFNDIKASQSGSSRTKFN